MHISEWFFLDKVADIGHQSFVKVLISFQERSVHKVTINFFCPNYVAEGSHSVRNVLIVLILESSEVK